MYHSSAFSVLHSVIIIIVIIIVVNIIIIIIIIIFKNSPHAMRTKNIVVSRRHSHSHKKTEFSA